MTFRLKKYYEHSYATFMKVSFFCKMRNNMAAARSFI